MTKQETAKIIAALTASYPSSGIKPDQIANMITVWGEMLADIDYAQADAACRTLIQTRYRMPSVADVRAAALELAVGRVRPGGEAWAGVTRAMQAEGAYRTPGVDFVFRDPVTARCVELMDWQYLCLSENTVADRARFIELYDQLAADTRRVAQSPTLAAARERQAIGAGAAVRNVLEAVDRANEARVHALTGGKTDA